MNENDFDFELDQQQLNSQFQESLYFLQANIDELKKGLDSVVDDNAQKDILLKEEIKRIVEALRGDIYQLNDKLESANRELTGIILSNFDEVKVKEQPLSKVDLSAILKKLDNIENRLVILELEKEQKAEFSEDRVYEMLEKLNSRLGVLMEDNQSKISDVRSEMESFKDSFTSVMSDSKGDSNDLDDSFNTLTSELDSLSKLVKEQTQEDEEMPSAILDISEQIANLANDVL